MSIPAFNAISHAVQDEKPLKKKVLLQAHFYKIAADLESNLKPLLPTLPHIAIVGRGGRWKVARHDEDVIGAINSEQDNELKRFCRSLSAVEEERQRMRADLETTLDVESLPANMCDPQMQRVMHKSVQQACQAFPSVAQKIVWACNMDTNRFNELKRKMDSDIWFRVKVNREIKRSRKQVAKTLEEGESQ